ncbi:MAG TPA: hypothetical protein VGF01_19195 [Terracidiphilus sp.]
MMAELRHLLRLGAAASLKVKESVTEHFPSLAKYCVQGWENASWQLEKKTNWTGDAHYII